MIFFSTKRKHKTNAWKFGLEKRVSSERPFSINHIHLHKEYKKDIWKDQLSSRAHKATSSKFPGWKNTSQVLPIATMTAAMEPKNAKGEGNRECTACCQAGVAKNNYQKFHPATDLGDLMAKYAQLPHFWRALFSEKPLTISSVSALMSITKADPDFSSWLHLGLRMAIFWVS